MFLSTVLSLVFSSARSHVMLFEEAGVCKDAFSFMNKLLSGYGVSSSFYIIYNSDLCTASIYTTTFVRCFRVIHNGLDSLKEMNS